MNVAALPLTVTADRGFTWSDEETLVLLELWNNIDAQSDLSLGNKRNAVMYEKISQSMNNVGFIRTASQCKEKIKRMKREYSLAKQKNKSSGNKKTMRFYELFEKILLEKQNKNPKSTLSKNCSTRSKQKKLVSLANETSNNQEAIQPVEKESNSPWSPDVVLIEENSLPLSMENGSSASDCSENDENAVRKKRKLNTHLTFFKSVINSLTEKFIKYQSESDAKMLNKIEELESQRNAMDERIQKMWMDFEERRKIDEKEHELKIMSTFKDIIARAKVSSSASTC